MSDLIERLQSDAASSREGYQTVAYVRTLTEAADELTALRSQVSELRADLEVACGALERLSNLPIDENDGPDILHLNGEALQGPAVDWTFKMVRKVKDIARATLNTIRKDG